MPKDNEALPPGLEWEKMEEGILQKMEEIKAAETTGSGHSKNGKLRTWGLAILLILLPVFCARFVVNPFQEKVDTSKELEKATDLPGSDNGREATTVVPQSPYGNKAPAAARDNTEQASVIHRSGRSIPNNEARNSNGSNAGQSSDESYNRQSVSNITQSNSPAIIIDTAASNLQTSLLTDIPEEQMGIADQTEGQAQRQLIQQIEQLLPAMEIKALEQRITTSNTLPVAPSTTIETEVVPKEQHLKPAGQLMLIAGVSSWNEGYAEAPPERAAYEQTIPSYHIQLHYLHTMDKGFLLMSGVQYQQLESRFDRVFAVNNHSITLQDTITHLITNVLTGQQAIIRGDVDLNVTAERRIRHYNKIQLYQIPIAVGKAWGHKKWQVYALVGGSVNIHTMNTGRTSFGGSLLDYDNTSTPFSKNQWKFNAQLAGRLSYQFADQLSIVGGIQYQKSLSNWSTEQNVQMRPSIINFELGLSYSIDKRQ